MSEKTVKYSVVVTLSIVHYASSARVYKLVEALVGLFQRATTALLMTTKGYCANFMVNDKGGGLKSCRKLKTQH